MLYPLNNPIDQIGNSVLRDMTKYHTAFGKKLFIRCMISLVQLVEIEIKKELVGTTVDELLYTTIRRIAELII